MSQADIVWNGARLPLFYDKANFLTENKKFRIAIDYYNKAIEKDSKNFTSNNSEVKYIVKENNKIELIKNFD